MAPSDDRQQNGHPRQFCARCGEPVASCDDGATCGRPAEPARFCVSCGRRLRDIVLYPSATVLSCPVHGSTSESGVG